MSQMSDYLEGQIRAHAYRTASWTKPSVMAVGLITANKGYWAASTVYATTDYVLPLTPNGRLYKCTTAGTSAASQPTWPTTNAGTVTDGTVVWTEQSDALDAATGSTMPEPAAGAYARVTRSPLDANWTAASATDGKTDNAAAITFPSPTSPGWGVIYGFFSVDAASAGNSYIWGALTTPKTVNGGDPAPSFAIGAVAFIFA